MKTRNGLITETPIPKHPSVPPPSAQAGHDLFDMRLDQIRPGLPASLSFKANAAIPRAVIAIFEPIPHPSVPMGQEDPGWTAEASGQMDGRVAHGRDPIASADQGGQAVDILCVVDIIEVLDAHASCAFDRLTLLGRIAVLQVDETAPRLPQQRLKVQEASGFRLFMPRIATSPGQPNDFAAI